MNDDPGAKVKKLGERLREEVEKVGLTLRHFAFIPNLEGEGPHQVQALFTVDGDPVDAEQEKYDAAFEELTRADQSQTLTDKVKKAKEAGSGILDMLDDDDEEDGDGDVPAPA